MTKKSRTLIVLYFVVATGELLSQLIGNDNLHHILKPLLMPVLGFYFIYKIKGGNRQVSILVLMALFLAWVGDVLLLLQKGSDQYFIMGLVSFLLAHIAYIVIYQRTAREGLQLKPMQQMAYLLPFVVLMAVMVYVLHGTLGVMDIPVKIYGAVILLMVLFAIRRYKRTSNGSFWRVLAGGAMFVVSDLLIGVDKFYGTFYLSSFFIMLTYIVAQYLIVEGVLHHELERPMPVK